MIYGYKHNYFEGNLIGISDPFVKIRAEELPPSQRSMTFPNMDFWLSLKYQTRILPLRVGLKSTQRMVSYPLTYSATIAPMGLPGLVWQHYCIQHQQLGKPDMIIPPQQSPRPRWYCEGQPSGIPLPPSAPHPLWYCEDQPAGISPPAASLHPLALWGPASREGTPTSLSL